MGNGNSQLKLIFVNHLGSVLKFSKISGSLGVWSLHNVFSVLMMKVNVPVNPVDTRLRFNVDARSYDVVRHCINFETPSCVNREFQVILGQIEVTEFLIEFFCKYFF